MSTLEIQLFGTLSLQRDGSPLPRFPSKRVKDLLSYLLLNRETAHPRDQLAGIFWGEVEEHKARHCLNTALWRLHGVLGQTDGKKRSYLRVDAQTIAFNTRSDVRLDVDEFEQRCTLAEQVAPSSQQQIDLYRDAIETYRGDLLIDCYEDWCLVERERLQAMYLRVLGRLVAALGSRGEHDGAIGYALAILACDPLREEVHRDLIGLYLAANQPAAALKQYRACEEILRTELGVPPMPETRALLVRIVEASRIGRPEEQCASRPYGDPGEELADALHRLRTARAAVEAARLELDRATSVVERLVDRRSRAAQVPFAG